MANTNLKTEKKKEYNPFVRRTIRTFRVGNVRGYLRAVKPNPKDRFGRKRVNEEMRVRNKIKSNYIVFDDTYSHDMILFYEVGANDGSYRKCRTIDEAWQRFVQLYKFEQRQTEIK